MTPARATFLFLLLPALTHGRAAAQCTATLEGASPVSAVSGDVRAMTQFDPDGTGPAPSLLVVVGASLTAGEQFSRHILAHDGTQWLSPGFPVIGAGSAPITAAAVFNGELVVAGSFNVHPTTGGLVMRSVGRWNGTTWSALGSGVGGTVQALAVHNGELFAAGSLTQAGFTPTNNIAKWNGTAWIPVGSGVIGTVHAMASFAGQLWVGGALTAAGGAPVSNLARWNGTSWSPAGNPNGGINALAVRTSTLGGSNTFLFAAGAFTSIGGATAQHVASIDGLAALAGTPVWSALGAGLPAAARCVTARNTGSFFFEVVAGVTNTSGPEVWRWNGTTWANLDDLFDPLANAVPRAILFRNGQYVTGLEHAIEAVRAFDSTAQEWSPLRGLGIDDAVYAVLHDGDDLVVGGSFTTIDGVVVNGIARRSGTTWSPLGSGVQGIGGWVSALARLPNGDLVAGGEFQVAGGVGAHNIARWNGSTWSAIGGVGVDGAVSALATLPDGQIVAAGSFSVAGAVAANRIARFDGVAWHPLGSGMNGAVRALAIAPDGSIVAVGLFTQAGGVPCLRIARWDGSAWSPLGSGLGGFAFAVAILRNGDVVAGGNFLTAGGAPAAHIARYDGVAWNALGAGADDTVAALLALPNGDLLAGGDFTSTGPVTRFVARWNGSSWSGLGAGILGSSVLAFAGPRHDEVVIGGDFHTAHVTAAGNLARLRTDCPALATPYGAGCSSPAGTPVLAATQEPWVGGTFASKTTGITAFGFPLAIVGVQQIAVPIALIVPQGYPGCMVLASIDLLEVRPLSPLGVDFSLPIPPSPALAGAQLFHQMAFLELDAGGAAMGIASSNGLEIVLGLL